MMDSSKNVAASGNNGIMVVIVKTCVWTRRVRRMWSGMDQ